MEYIRIFLEEGIKFLLVLIHGIASTCILISIYLIKSEYNWLHFGSCCDRLINACIYLLVPIALSLASLLTMKKFSPKDSITNPVCEIASVNNDYLPTYLGYIFVSLSIPNPKVGEIDGFSVLIIYLLICIFVVFSKSLRFNPLFVVLGYSYYSVKTKAGIRLFVLTNRKINKNDLSPNFPKLGKITETLYIEK